ncbi:DUF397 domain-containing protein [Streptomyces sp. 5-10]|nr:DUF397 domain-containing protein [Streptomyces sp. 5-10]
MLADLGAIDLSEVTWSTPGDGNQAIEVGRHASGAVFLRRRDDPERVHRFTAEEWRAFVLGARDGEFDLS